MISEKLLEVLACPSSDHAPLTLRTVGDVSVLVCDSCLSEFDIRDGIPVLLPDEARPGPNGLGVAASGRPDATAEPGPA